MGSSAELPCALASCLGMTICLNSSLVVKWTSISCIPRLTPQQPLLPHVKGFECANAMHGWPENTDYKDSHSKKQAALPAEFHPLFSNFPYTVDCSRSCLRGERQLKKISKATCLLAAALFAVPAFGSQTIAIVSDLGGNQLFRFDAETGQYLGSFGGGFFSSGPAGMTIASDGQLYVGDLGSNGIMRFDPLTGQYEGSIGVGMATGVLGLTADGNGNIYASSGTTIYRYQANTGLYEGQVGTGWSSGGYYSLACSSDGSLYASGDGSVFRFESSTGVFEGQVGSGYVAQDNYSLALDPSGGLYAASSTNKSMLHFIADTGLYDGSFGSGMLNLATGCAYDFASNSILVDDFGSGMIRRYSAADGTYENSFGLGAGAPYGIVILSVPEPAGIGLLAVGLAGLFVKRSRRG